MEPLDRFLDSKYVIYVAVAIGVIIGTAVGLSL